jgi:hypothetical protein
MKISLTEYSGWGRTPPKYPTIDTSKLQKPVAAHMEEIVNDIHFFDIPEDIRNHDIRDAGYSVITVTKGRETHTVEADLIGEDKYNEDLKMFIEHVKQLVMMTEKTSDIYEFQDEVKAITIKAKKPFIVQYRTSAINWARVYVAGNLKIVEESDDGNDIPEGFITHRMKLLSYDSGGVLTCIRTSPTRPKNESQYEAQVLIINIDG